MNRRYSDNVNYNYSLGNRYNGVPGKVHCVELFDGTLNDKEIKRINKELLNDKSINTAYLKIASLLIIVFGSILITYSFT